MTGENGKPREIDAIAAAGRRRTITRRANAGEHSSVARPELKRRILAAWTQPAEQFRLTELAAIAWPGWKFSSAQGAALAIAPIVSDMLRNDRTLVQHREGRGPNRYGLSDRGWAQSTGARNAPT